MEKHYSKFLIFAGLFFLANIIYSQEALVNSDYGSQIQSYLNYSKESLNLSDNDIEDLIVSDEYFSKSTEITHVYVNQRFQGVPVHNAISSVAIKDNAVFYYADNFTSGLSGKINTTTAVVSAEQAILNAASHYNLGAVLNLELLSSSDKEFTFSNGSISQVNIPVKLVFQTTDDGNLRLAWDLSIHTKDGKNWWSTRIDAISGEVISTNDWILTCNFGDGNHLEHDTHEKFEKTNKGVSFNLFKENTSLLVDGSQYNVYAIPDEGPLNDSRTLVNEPASVVGSPFGWHDTDGAPGAEYTITRGNNVWAQEDRDANDGTGYSPDGTATLNFDFPLDLNQPPALYEDVSITNLFYMNNIMHDVWYQYGFDEVSGNFQENNYGNGGNGGDFVFADGQDGSGLNNATFGTPPDGGNPGMTMFLHTAIGPPGDPLTINTGALAGDYSGLPAVFGGILSSTPITADLALINDSTPADVHDACEAITNGSDLAGKIVVIRRGDCEFGFKMLAAENEGAIAVIMVNNVPDPIIPMGAGAVGDQVTIPGIMISQADGNALIDALNNGETINGTLIDAGPYQRDGDLDNQIVAHEYGHGISFRLIGGPSNVNCLNNGEQMGEGWSDWVGLMLTMKVGDVAETPREFAFYSFRNGLRPLPYTTDLSINDVTYGDTNNTNFSQPHGIGFIWASMLWDLTWAYVDKYGFDPDFYNGNGGNNKAMQVVIDGMKLMACNGGFVRGRDGILAADMALTGGEDQCMIWEVFAARGVGLNASQGNPQPRNDQTEDFTMPPDTDPSLANCTSLSIDEFNFNDYKIYPNPSNDKLFIRTNKSYGEVTLTLTDINGRQVLSQKVNLFDTVELDINSLQSGMYILNMKGEQIDANEKIIKK